MALVDTGKGYIQDRRKFDRLIGLAIDHNVSKVELQLLRELDRRTKHPILVRERRMGAKDRRSAETRRKNFYLGDNICGVSSLNRRENCGRRKGLERRKT